MPNNFNQTNKNRKNILDKHHFTFDDDEKIAELYVKYGIDIHRVNSKNQRNALFTLDYKKSLFLVKNGINIHQVDKQCSLFINILNFFINRWI